METSTSVHPGASLAVTSKIEGLPPLGPRYDLADLCVLPAERWSAFDVNYPLLFSPPPSLWTFDIRRPDGSDARVTAEPTDDAARLAVRERREQAASGEQRRPLDLHFYQ